MASKVLITGGSRGIGRACAERLAADGYEVTVVARTTEQVADTVEHLAGNGHRGAVFDVSDAAAWKVVDAPKDGFDAVVCAAGVIGPIGAPPQIDPADFAQTLAINVGGVYNAVRSLPLKAGAPMVAFSGGGATGPFPRFDAYAASKAALVRLVENLAADGMRINAVAPGLVVTEIQNAVLAAGPERAGREYYDKVRQAVDEDGGEDPAVAADCVAWLLSDASIGVTGKLIAAKWDPWRDADFIARLRDESDLATLRRIDDQFFAAK